MQNAYLLAKIGADTDENERTFARILTKIGNVLADESADQGHAAAGKPRVLLAPSTLATFRPFSAVSTSLWVKRFG